MIRQTRSLILSLLMTWPLAAAAQPAAAPRTVDGAAIDPDAELVVALADDTTNMDPRIGMGSIRSNYIRQVFEGLVDVDSQGRPVPGLALSWKPAGELTWEFALRRGVTFHDGEPFNADTVLFNLDRFFRKNLDKLGLKDVLAATSFEKTYPFVTRWEKVRRLHRAHPHERARADALGFHRPRAHGAQGLHAEARRRRAQRPSGRHRPLEDGRVEAQDVDAVREERRLLGHPAALPEDALPDDPRGRRAHRRAAGRPGRAHRGRAALRRARARAGFEAEGGLEP